MKFPKFLWTPILKKICERLLLKIVLKLYKKTQKESFVSLSTIWKTFLSHLAECQKSLISGAPNNHCSEKFHKIPETFVTLSFLHKSAGCWLFCRTAPHNYFWTILGNFPGKTNKQSRWCVIDRSSHWSCSVKKGVLKNFAKFTGKHLCQSLFF